MSLTKEAQWAYIERRAKERGVSVDALRKWRERGVPHKERLPLLRDAASAGITLDDDTFIQPPAKSSEAA